MPKMRLALLLLVTGILGISAAGRPAASAVPPSQAASTELVVLLHGMGRTTRSMAPLERAIQAAGYDVLSLGYSSYCCSIAELGDSVRLQLDARRGAHTTVHFVGHSLGGILARWIVAQPSPPPGVGRIVMIAPPNQGSHSADFYSPVAGWLLEPMRELRTDSVSTVRRMSAPHGVEIGVIAGLHDGKVTVDATHLVGEADHATVDAHHTFIMRSDDVHRLTVAFLRDGSFRSVHLAVQPR